MSSAALNSTHHLSVTVVQNSRPIVYRVLDVRRDYPPLITELAWRAAAAEPSAAGARWVPSVRLEDQGQFSPQVVLEAYLADEDGTPCAETLAALEVPGSAFSWIAADIAAAAHITGEYAYVIAAHEAHSKVIDDWNLYDGNKDFEFLAQDEPRLVLPDGFFTAQLPGPDRVIDAVDSWLQCAFEREAFETFLASAIRETQNEHSWLGLGHVCLTRDTCRVVIEPGLVELPGEKGRSWVFTRGRDWAKLHRRLGDRFVAFLHLHPPTVNGEPLAPQPSKSDAVVAWNFSSASRAPVVFPIAMFGPHDGVPGSSMAAYGYERGLLRRIQLAVLP